MRKRITNNLALKILAFLIAAFLWLVVVNIDDPVDDKTFYRFKKQVNEGKVKETIKRIAKIFGRRHRSE